MDDSKSLHRKWLFHQTSINKWLFRVPGRSLGTICGFVSEHVFLGQICNLGRETPVTRRHLRVFVWGRRKLSVTPQKWWDMFFSKFSGSLFKVTKTGWVFAWWFWTVCWGSLSSGRFINILTSTKNAKFVRRKASRSQLWVLESKLLENEVNYIEHTGSSTNESPANTGITTLGPNPIFCCFFLLSPSASQQDQVAWFDWELCPTKPAR